jgi:hypothetical protein
MTRRLIAGAAGTVLALATMAAAGTAKPTTGSPARSDSGTGYFSITHQKGGFEYTAGDVKDKVFGDSAIIYKLKTTPSSGAIKVDAKKVVLYTSQGSLSGTATATIADLSAKIQKVTDGKLTLTKGTGGLKGDKLTATFSGTANITKNMFKFSYQGKLTT